MSATKTETITPTDLINDIEDINFGEISLIISGIWLLIFVVRKVLPFLAERSPSQLRLYLLGAVPIIRLTLIMLAITWVVSLVFNITVQNFFVIAGAASVAVGFAFKDFASSLLAGVVAIIERPYRPGDWVKIDGDYGEVKSVGLRTIDIVTPNDDTIIIPHDKIWTKNISNANDGAQTLMCVVRFYLEPNHDAKVVKLTLLDVAITSAYLSYSKRVKIMIDQTKYGTRYKIKAYPFDSRDQFELVADITVRAKEALRELGIQEVTAMPPPNNTHSH